MDRQFLIENFKMSGLRLKVDATTYLQEIIAQYIGDSEKCLNDIITSILKRSLSSSLVDKELIEEAAKECNFIEDAIQSQSLFEYVDAFKLKKLEYNFDNKKFLSIDKENKILANPEERMNVFRGRYITLLQRTKNHVRFTSNPDRNENSEEIFKLKTVEYLKACPENETKILVLGMIVQLKEDKYFIEDLTGHIEMNIKGANYFTGFFVEGCIILAEGWVEEGIFNVTTIGHPPPEERSKTNLLHPGINFFGGKDLSGKFDRILNLEQQDDAAQILFLSDVHLDNDLILDKLKILFQGYQDYPPIAIVLLGNFLSTPTRGVESSFELRDSLVKLANIIYEFPKLVRHTTFLFVPGPSDPGRPLIYPKPGFPEVITRGFTEKIPNVIFASNPCRIRYCTKEIIIFREDTISRFCRNSIHYSSECEYVNVPSLFVKTLIGQSHLSPFSIYVTPVYWGFDHAMSLYPLPDILIYGDKSEAYTIFESGKIFVNPGSFLRNNFSFKAYMIKENKIDDCMLPSGDD